MSASEVFLYIAGTFLLFFVVVPSLIRYAIDYFFRKKFAYHLQLFGNLERKE